MKKLILILLVLTPATVFAVEYAPVRIDWQPPIVYESGATLPPTNLKSYTVRYDINDGDPATDDGPVEIPVLIPAGTHFYVWTPPADRVGLENGTICFDVRALAVTLAGNGKPSAWGVPACVVPKLLSAPPVLDDTPPTPPVNVTATNQ